jgi:uncharacterized protein YggT (Ycf19 family)
MHLRPVIVFLLVMVIIAPSIAIAGVVAWGDWAPTGLMVAGALVVWSGRRALVPIRRWVPTFGGLQLRMKAVVWMVVVAAGLLTAGSAAWLGWRLVG